LRQLLGVRVPFGLGVGIGPGVCGAAVFVYDFGGKHFTGWQVKTALGQKS